MVSSPPELTNTSDRIGKSSHSLFASSSHLDRPNTSFEEQVTKKREPARYFVGGVKMHDDNNITIRKTAKNLMITLIIF